MALSRDQAVVMTKPSPEDLLALNDLPAITTKQSPFSVKVSLAQMLHGSVIMDVVNVEQARIAEEADACTVMALKRVSTDIRAHGAVDGMRDRRLIKEIKQVVTIPVMAKARFEILSNCVGCV
ncbi:hypothetical protein QQ045_032428 [Rhodiola kirilowii]